jgi:hypothetical protein
MIKHDTLRKAQVRKNDVIISANTDVVFFVLKNRRHGTIGEGDSPPRTTRAKPASIHPLSPERQKRSIDQINPQPHRPYSSHSTEALLHAIDERNKRFKDSLVYSVLSRACRSNRSHQIPHRVHTS